MRALLGPHGTVAVIVVLLAGVAMGCGVLGFLIAPLLYRVDPGPETRTLRAVAAAARLTMKDHRG